ncbi:uncharacterized protein BDZ99DRAFT_500708 [Mytilinidion resinicola]|uniref:Myb-like domain-containing protein n=1 Tax=Mytilinidion resinicola TaxID=574789 RepID=A0A6A6YD16_9PEZI|nr:uncharacterized protein BDZ99DRAFT_500708 [Mytilinidion resinicola]KAF2806600.1 hypothetical protein BDZ99DRAFT_500708 [Mytilinidion resinicola]
MEHPSKRPRIAILEEPDSSSDLNRDRSRNDNRLKGAFENIFLKYTKDFTNVGDEIDLQTGEIVVNNGHISRMRNEQDVGEGDAGAILRAFADDMAGTISDGDDIEESQSGDIVTSGLDQGDEIEGAATCDDDTNSEAIQPTATGESSAHSRMQGPSQAGHTTPVGRQPPEAAIEALSRGIGMQIAQFITQWQPSPSVVNSLWSAPPLPQRTPRRRDASQSLSRSLLRRPVSPQTGSIWAVPDPTTGVRSIRPVPRRVVTERRFLHRDNRSPHVASHDEDPEDASDEEDDEEEGKKQNFPTYLDRSRQYSANTSAKMAHKGRKSRYQFSDEDNVLLLELKEDHQFPWATICSYWPDRPPWIVQHHYHKHLKNQSPGSAESISRPPDQVEDKLAEPAISKERSISRASETSQVSTPGISRDFSVPSSPLQIRQRPFRMSQSQRPVASPRDTTVDCISPELEDWNIGASADQDTADILSEQLESSNENESPEIPDSQESIKSRSSPKILPHVESVIIRRTPSASKKVVGPSDRKSISGRLSGLSSGISNARTSLGGFNPRLMAATPRAAKTPIVEQESDEELDGSPASNLVSISSIMASPKTSSHRKHSSGRSGSKPKYRRVSDVRVPSKPQHTPSRSSGLKRTIDMYEDEDDSLDELTLV